MMGMRETSDLVQAELEKGASRQAVFQLLSSAMPSDRGKIAYLIASVPTDHLRQKYLKQNAALFILLLIYPLLNVAAELPIDFSKPTIFLLIRVVLPFIFSYFVFRFHGGVYRVAGIWFLVELLETLLLTGAPNGLAALKLIALFFVVVLSFTIGRKVFYNLGVIGPKKDVNGNYLL